MSSPSWTTPPPAIGPVRGRVGRGVEVNALGDRARAHVGVVDVLEFADGDAEFLLGLTADRGFGVLIVEQPGGGFDEHAVGMVVDVGREPELAGEQHSSAVGVVEQDRGAVAAVVGLALLGFPATVAATVVKGGAAQHVPPSEVTSTSRTSTAGLRARSRPTRSRPVRPRLSGRSPPTPMGQNASSASLARLTDICLHDTT